METKCKGECALGRGPSCGADKNTIGYICSRDKGHEGEHVACGSNEHDLCVWPNTQNDNEKAVKE